MVNLKDIDNNALPTWGSYEQRPKSENIESFVPKTPYELYIEKEQKDKQKNTNINKQAIENIPTIPDFVLAEQGYSGIEYPSWYKQLNVASEDEIEEWKKKGKMGFAETWQKKKKWEMLPYAGTSADMTLTLRNANTLRKLKHGENVSDVDKELLVDFLRDVKEEEVRGGHTWLGNALNGLMTSVPYIGEFAAAVATSEAGIGFVGAAETISNIAARKAARKAIQAEIKRLAVESTMTGVKKNISGATTKAIYNQALKDFTKGGVKQTAKSMSEVGFKGVAKEIIKETPKAAYTSGKAYVTRTPQNFVNAVAGNQLQTGAYVTDAGDVVFTDSEHIATSIMKSLASGTFDFMTETTGFMFAPLESWFAKPVRKMLPKKFFTEFDKLVSSQFGMSASDAFRKYGYDGVVDEMGEELLNRFLCQTFGLNGLDDYTLDGFLNNVLYFDDPSQWASEALSFAAMSGSGHLIYGANSKINNKIAKNKAEKEIAKFANATNAEKFSYRAEATKKLQDDFAKYLKSHPIQLSRNSSPEEFERKYEDAKLAFLKENGMSVEEYYLEQGLIKIDGSQSAAEKMLREKFEERGIDKATADEFVNNSSELEIRKQLKQFIDEDEADADKRRSKAVDMLANKMLENESYKNKDLAQKNANLIVTALEKMSETNGIPIEQLIQDEAPTIRNQSVDAVEETPEAEENRVIDDRLKVLEQEFSNMNEENWDDEKFDALENEYNELVERKNQGEVYYQNANIAGAESGEYLPATEEWEDKGTESKYFKKWFGDSKVVDENGQPLVVYHGTTYSFEEFEPNNPSTDIDFPESIYFSSSKSIAETYGDVNHKFPMELYLRIENPLELDASGMTYNDFYDTLKEQVKFAVANNYDGLIVKNIRDDWSQRDDGGEIATTYIVFTPEQIKSVNNQGTFDAKNPNIYYQSAYHGSPYKFDEFSTDFIGNGEGAQAHGWGLYFARNKDVSESYRQKLLLNGSFGTKYDIKINGKPADAETRRYILNNFSTRAINNIMENPSSFNEEIKDYVNAIKLDIERNDKWLQTWRDAIDFIDKNPKMSITEFNNNLKKEDKYRFKYIIQNAKNKAKKEGRKTTVKDIQAETKIFLQPHQERIDKEKEQLEKLSKIDNLEIKQSEGQLFEVDIPDDNVLLDENKNFKEQSKDVQNSLIDLIYQEKMPNEIIEGKGRDIYNNIKDWLKDGYNPDKNVAKEASLLLNDYGIKGIKYDGLRDGQSYVVFDDKAVNVLNKYYQFAGEGSETADKHSLMNARKMLANGDNAEYVRKTTGWYKGVDGKFRYEISDNDAVVNVDNIKKARKDEIDWVNLNITDYNTRMSDLVQRHDAKEINDEDFREQYDSLMNRKLEEVDALKFYENKGYSARLENILDHEKLYAAYPSLRTLRVEFRPHPYGRLGTYSNAQNEISMDLTLLYGKESELKEVLMHEVQHYIQHREGFAVGGNPQAVENILADAKDAIKNSKDSKDYDFVMKKYSIVNNLLLIRSIQDKPENITKSYWWMQQGKGWYAPRKTRKKDRAKYINECCQEFIDYSIAKHKENNTFEAYKNYSKKDTAELKKEARRLQYRAGKILDKLSPNFKNLGRIEGALKQFEQYEINTFDLYQRLAGETEARNTANRTNLSDKERLEKSPSETSDVPEAEQLVVFDDGTMAYSESDMSNENQGNLFFDNLKAKNLQKIKGYYLPAENLIELFKNADESTIIHEFAHWWLDRLVKYSGDNEEISEDIAAVRKWLKNDGEEFTREQHEKFAVGFETYIRSGYAKNNRLKKIFEDFKNALLAIYDSIKQLVYYENGEKRYFSEADIETLQNLFDRLLTTEHERIKATVFDKIAEIDAKIENIKEHETEEFAELDEMWKDNIAALNRKSDKQRKVEEYLHLAETIPFRETKETREFKKRYKNVTLDILATISGNSRAWVANPRNWEKLQEYIGNADDQITASNGFLPEWSEFYADTGVSYENDEIDGEYKLGQQAFDVLSSGSYEKTWDENYEFADIDAFITKMDYLVAKMKTVKGEEKAAVYDAIFRLYDKIPAMPDEATKSVLDKLLKAAEEYQEQQKDDFNKKRYPNIPVVQQLQFYITRKLSDLKVYNPETRYKMRINKSHRLYRYIQNVNSVNAAKKQIRRINDFVIDDMRNNQRSLLHKEIQKQIRVNSRVVKVGTMTKGKFDWKTNTVFSELVEMNKMSRQDAEKELGNYVQIQDADKSEARESYDENETGEFNKSNDFQDILKKEFLQYRSMKLQDLDVTHTIQLLQDILELKEQGRKAKSEEDFINRTQKWNTKNNLLDILEITKQSGAKFGANWIAGVGGFKNILSLSQGSLANWESILNAVFNKDTAQKYSILKDEADTEVYARNHMKYFYKRAAEIYGFQNANWFNTALDFDNIQPIVDLFRKYDNEKHTYTQQVFSINSPDGIAKSSIELSRSQLITMFAWSLNDQLEQRLMTQFGVEQIMDMFENKLSKEDKDLAWALVDTCEQMREDINEVFIRTTGLSLPKVDNYFPSKAERVQSDIDMYHDFFVKSTNPSFIKQRKTCNRIPMKPMSPLEILIPHINKTARYVVLSEKVNFLNQVFKDAAIKTKMQEIWGKDGERIYQVLINKLGACTFTNYSKGTNLIAGWADKIANNYTTANIGFSGKVAIGQLLSVVNYAENMPFGTWAKGFANTLKHPVENFKYMLENCEYLQARLAGNSQNEVISILTSEKDNFRKLKNFMTSNTKWGDIIAITLGGKPYVDYLMNEKGMSKEDAFSKFVEDTLRAQQAGTTSSISNFQANMSQNCLARMFFAFQNTTYQYERKFVDTLIQAKRGDIGKKEALKRILIYKVLNPVMFTHFLTNLGFVELARLLFGGDDPNDAVKNSFISIAEAIFLSGFKAYGIAGFAASIIIESVIASFDDNFAHFKTSIPILTELEETVNNLLKGDLDFWDYVDAAAFCADTAVGISAQKAVKTYHGFEDLLNGEYGIGASEIFGWGRYTSTKAWTGKEPDKKRKKKKRK